MPQKTVMYVLPKGKEHTESEEHRNDERLHPEKPFHPGQLQHHDHPRGIREQLYENEGNWYGTCVYKASTSVLNSKTRQYPSHYGSSRTSRYKKDIANKQVVSDCVGGCKGYAWTNGGQGVLESIGTDQKYTSKYGSNGCPDKSASGMFSYCKSKGMDWGTIDTLPEIVGLALFTDGHIGYYVGEGYAVEWRGLPRFPQSRH